MRARDKKKPNVPFQFRKVARRIKYKGREFELYAAPVFRSIVRKSYYQLVKAEKGGKLPRPMFTEESTGKRFYTVWELFSAAELVRKKGTPNFSAKRSIFGDELNIKWAEIRKIIEAGGEPPYPITISYPSRDSLENDLVAILEGFVETRGAVRKIAERIIERHVNSRGL